ncbi:MAG: acetyl-CoA C-acetyltransferase, partial [Bosea sp.]|nr:acetyl-CoA C-acetyltransferase [Bosea sp. (in: a-proteobacteria)]
ITRDMQDQFALTSQNRAEAAQKAGKFKDEIVPVTIKSRKGDIVVDADEYPRHGATIDAMAKLRAAFEKDGTVTAGNASGIVDGAASLVATTAERAAADGRDVGAKISGWGISGCDPTEMGLGPVPSIKACLERTGVSLDQLDRIEINEAFSAQYLGCEKELGLGRDKVNVNGGAIS